MVGISCGASQIRHSRIPFSSLIAEKSVIVWRTEKEPRIIQYSEPPTLILLASFGSALVSCQTLFSPMPFSCPQRIFALCQRASSPREKQPTQSFLICTRSIAAARLDLLVFFCNASIARKAKYICTFSVEIYSRFSYSKHVPRATSIRQKHKAKA